MFKFAAFGFELAWTNQNRPHVLSCCAEHSAVILLQQLQPKSLSLTQSIHAPQISLLDIKFSAETEQAENRFENFRAINISYIVEKFKKFLFSIHFLNQKFVNPVMKPLFFHKFIRGLRPLMNLFKNKGFIPGSTQLTVVSNQ